jgi:ribonuclease Z
MATTQLGLPYALEFVDVHGLDGADVLPDLAVRATALSHRLPSWAYGFTERAVERHLDGGRLRAAGIAPGPAWGQLQRGEELVLDDGRVLDPEDFLLPPRKPRKVIVAGDNDRPELLVDEARTAQVLVHEATYTEPVLQKVGQAPQHSSAAMTAGAASAAGVPNLVLTHFSPRYQDAARREGDGLSMRDLELEARAQYSGRLFLARDFERYALDRKGVLARLD